MRKFAFFALAVVAVACSSDPTGEATTGPAPNAENTTPSQMRAFEALKSDTNVEWTWLQHAKMKSVMHLSASRTGKPILPKGGSAEATTIAFLGKYRELFRMGDAASELRLEKSEVDELSMSHVRFQQVTRGVVVEGAELAAHYDAAGRLTSIDSNYVPGADAVDIQPKIDAKAGLLAAKLAVEGVDPALLTADEGRLIVYAGEDREPTLAYRYSVRSDVGEAPAIWVTTVDAKTGAVINRYDDIQTIEATATGVAGDTKKFQVTQTGTTYTMTDSTRGAIIRTNTAANQQTIPGQSITSTSLTTWDRTPTGPGAAVDAHFNATAVYDYYKAKHARNAINGAGGAMISTAHFGNNYDNAFWDPQRGQMAYGDGGNLFRPLSAGLDVVAHEFTHGVTSSTSNLIYQGQSGAMNESVSDIFGAFIEHAVKPDEVNNWKMGEAISKTSGTLRDFKNPAAGRQPAHMRNYVNTQQDNGGVHINSGIPNNAAYLMTSGGTNPVSNVQVAFGIGWEKAEKLWFRANTRYFTSSTNFAQAAQGVMQAAKDIALTENEQNIVDCAWKATGVVQGTCATLTNPQSVPNTPGDGTGDGTGTGGGATDPDDPSGGDVGDPGTDDESGGSSSAPKKRRPTAMVQESSGCNVASSGGTGGADPRPLAGLFAAVVGLAISRRKRR
ncbi:MAG: M4 family metallopeptidase [Labilithrix sp.]|nr:M4 family metallopeptidase [Labilithrix sp.]